MTRTSDIYDLQRFVDAQARPYPAVLAELRAGEKTSHWVWFIFPQLKGLGSSFNAMYFGIGSLAEARAYLAHEVLGPRLIECVSLLLAAGTAQPDIERILGEIDALKFKSSMTLFALAAPGEPLFVQALQAFYGGERDEQTVRRLGA
jgi:uncharacterized protein (DUF1810 family)